MIASERTQFIISRLQEKGVVTFKQMSQELNVSESTIRRDFEKLEKNGELKIVPGGAVLNSCDDLNRLSKILYSGHISNVEAKTRVAETASRIIQDGDCIFVDGGDNLACLAPYVEKRNIRIVTNSGLFVLSLTVQPVELIILGGNYYIDKGFSAGNLYQQALKQFHFDKVFVGCSGVNLSDGTVYSVAYDAMAAKTIAMENGEQRYLLFDSEKLDKRGFCKIGKLDAFDKIICNRCPELENGPSNLILV